VLKLLLEEHISPDVASALRRRNRALVVHSMVVHCMAEWEGSGFLAGCGKTPIRVGSGKGTSSTRAVTATKSTAASSRWGNAELGKHFFRSLLGEEDSACLLEAAKQRLTLVTYDRRTIPPLLKLWAEEQRSHGGVIFVDEKTISPANIGALVRALTQLSRETGKWDWTDRVYFLRRQA